MKHWKLAVALICFGSSVQAKQFGFLPDNYMRFIDLSHPITSFGAFVDAREPSKTSMGKATALITHDPKDGCLFPNLVCEQWAPVTTSFSINAGKLHWNLGPAINLTPEIKASVLWALNQTTPIDSLIWLKILLARSTNTPGASLAIGPNLGTEPIQNGALQPFDKWDPRLVIFTGAEFRW